MVKSTF